MKKNVLKSIGEFGKKESPAILAGLAVVGLIGTVVAAYKAGAKADKILEEHKKNMELVDPEDKEAKKAVQKETAIQMVPVIAPVVIMGAATAACIIGSQKASKRRIAALSAAYTVAESSVKELNGKMKDMFGEKKVREIKDSIAKDKVNADPAPSQNQIIMTGEGDVLCKDLYSGRYFRSNAQKIGQAINTLSNRVRNEMYVSLNDLYDLLNIPLIPLGDDLGWNVDDIYDGNIPITFTAVLNEKSEPCLCVEYDIQVRTDFRSFH